jgi:regulator of protease activity HflC (stomatin/prohibitin superfamily)
MDLKALALRVALNPGVRKAAFALVVAVLAALGISLGSGCHQLTPAQEAKALRFACEVEALTPVVGPAIDVYRVIHDLYTGAGDLGTLMRMLDLSEAEAKALVDRLNACVPEPAPEPLPEGEAL